MSSYHIPVLLSESVDALDIQASGIYADLTFGGGGHSREILSRLGPGGRLVSFDQDSDARENIPDDERLAFVESNFRWLRGQLRLLGIEQVDGILADLGVSSHHFDAEQRGFSFRWDGPLDMRMNQRGVFTAEKLVNTYSNAELIRVLRDWGEVDMPHKAANCIERTRTAGPITTIHGLIEAIKPCTPARDESKYLSKVFQALRIEVNGEMEVLKMALEQSLKVLKPGGRLVVISYHSLEDRLVKNFIKTSNFEGHMEKDFYGHPLTPFEVVTRKAIVPTDKEIAENPRSRSAKLRVAAKK